MYEPGKEDKVNPCIDLYKAKIKYGGSLEKINLGIVVRGDLKNKEIIVYNWSLTS